MILNGFDINLNFWKLNPQLKIPLPFATIYNEDKSKAKSKSSQVMWAIALLVDPDSKFSNISYSTRKDMISKDYLKNDGFDWDKYKDAINFYERSLITPAKRQLMVWEKKMDEKMKCLYRELDRRKKYLITKINNEIGHLSDLWFDEKISDKEYCVRFENLKKRLIELEG